MAPERLRLESGSAAETRAVAARLARALPAGAVVALTGDLGAGKTCFVAGLAVGLGIEEAVTSPTYTLMHEYRSADGERALVHLDAWMAGRERGFLEGGGAEWLASSAVAAVEWADRVAAYLPRPHVTVRLAHRGEDRRSLELGVAGAGADAAAAADLRAAVAAAAGEPGPPGGPAGGSEPGGRRNPPEGPNPARPGALE